MSDTLLQDAGTVVTETPAPQTTQTTEPSQTQTTQTVETAVTQTAPQVQDPVVQAKAEEAAKPSFPENWRELLAAGDDKKLKQLQRYSDPSAFAQKAWSLEAKLSSGEYKRDLPKDATPEQIKEWRQEQGLPDTPEDYKIELPNGVVLGEMDKQTVADLQKFGFEKNLPPKVLSDVTAWYYAKQDELNKQQEVADTNYHEESKDSLMSEWGLKDYRQNLAAMASVRDQMPAGLADRILAGRTADGRLIGDDPTFLRWFAALSRELNPHATVVGLEAGKTVESELEGIRRMRREDPNAYDADKKLQARELELLAAQSKQKARQG